MITPDHKILSIRKQCEILDIPRSSVYYEPIPEKPENVKMMNLMDKHLMVHPTEGVISMVNWLREKGYPVGPKRIQNRSLRAIHFSFNQNFSAENLPLLTLKVSGMVSSNFGKFVSISGDRIKFIWKDPVTFLLFISSKTI